MKIAIGTPSNLDGSDKSGFSPAFKMIQNALSVKHKITVFSIADGYVALKHKPLPVNNLKNKYNNTIALSKEFAKEIKKQKYDRILAYTNMGLFLNEDFIYYTSNIPYKKVSKLVKNEYPENTHFEKLLKYYKFIGQKEQENYLKAKKIITLSLKIKESLIRDHKINPKKIFYIPRPIEERKWSKLKKQTNPKKIKIIIMPTELRVMKGVKYAIETMKLLKKEVPNAILIICGKTNAYEEDYMNQLLKEAHGKANIINAGYLPKEKLYEYMQEAECAFMPFCFDECPIALNECLGFGLPLVTNEYAGYKKNVINKFGYCAKYKDIKDYKKGLIKMLTEPDYNQKKRDEIKKLYKEFTFVSAKE